ncbi:putative DNA-binding protein ESCAROLA-like [Capsicum annuum]|nr:uncharacterized protein LOC107864967 [Capsicum annuum]KAF3680958.1 putative DNA-binding protein ESCAROLA-like [Capsicum annuum]
MSQKNCYSEVPPGFSAPRSTNPPPSNITITPTISHHSEKCIDDYARHGAVPPRKQQRAVSAEARAMSTPATPLGSSINAPLLIIDEDQNDTKMNLNPLSKLNPPPNPCSRVNAFSSSHISDESKTIVAHVKSVLVFQLTSGSTKNVEDMVKCANNAFFTLDFLGADYKSFYKDVRHFITYHYDLLTAERQRAMQSFPTEMKTRYENAIVCANDLKEEIVQIQGHIGIVMKKKENLERQISDAMELIGKLKECVAVLKQEEGALNHEKQKCVVAYEIAHQEAQNICSQAEAVKNVLREIDQRKNAALNGIESVTHHLKSLQF